MFLAKKERQMESQTSYTRGKTSSGDFKFLSKEAELVDRLYKVFRAFVLQINAQ
jgi:hypothetical protein